MNNFESVVRGLEGRVGIDGVVAGAVSATVKHNGKIYTLRQRPNDGVNINGQKISEQLDNPTSDQLYDKLVEMSQSE